MQKRSVVLKNKRLHETLNMAYSDFRIYFAKEIQLAFESYRRTQLNKYPYKFQDDNSLEFNFYFDLQWNFNHHGNSVWYIERLI